MVAPPEPASPSRPPSVLGIVLALGKIPLIVLTIGVVCANAIDGHLGSFPTCVPPPNAGPCYEFQFPLVTFVQKYPTLSVTLLVLSMVLAALGFILGRVSREALLASIALILLLLPLITVTIIGIVALMLFRYPYPYHNLPSNPYP